MRRNTIVRNLSFLVALRPPTEGHPKWYAETPSHEGCFSDGDTVDEATENFKLAFHNYTFDEPLTRKDLVNLDSMAPMWTPEYQGYTFKITSTDLTVEAE